MPEVSNAGEWHPASKLFGDARAKAHMRLAGPSVTPEGLFFSDAVEPSYLTNDLYQFLWVADARSKLSVQSA